MLKPLDDTIAAIASADGGASRGIVRVSGPHAIRCVQACFVARDGSDLAALSKAWRVAGELQLMGARVPCDAWIWPNERSFTRQPTVELHTIGSPPLLAEVVETLLANGSRRAEPGEFTLRAFLSGRIDLAQAEAVLGVIDAVTTDDLAGALDQLAGGITSRVVAARQQLMNMLAEVEAGLDFVDEDLDLSDRASMAEAMAMAIAEIEALDMQLAARGQHQIQATVVLCGLPNSGKSSLFNRLLGGERALVADVAGTTRDVLAGQLDLFGSSCQLLDTAGFSSAEDEGLGAIDVEAISASAQRLGQRARAASAIELYCVDSSRGLCDEDARHLVKPSDRRLIVLTKADLPRQCQMTEDCLAVSSQTGAGVDTLRERIAERLIYRPHDRTQVVAGTADRCRDDIRQALVAARQAAAHWNSQAGEELVAAELRTAWQLLARVTGGEYSDELLDHIFSRFCIGK